MKLFRTRRRPTEVIRAIPLPRPPKVNRITTHELLRIYIFLSSHDDADIQPPLTWRESMAMCAVSAPRHGEDMYSWYRRNRRRLDVID